MSHQPRLADSGLTREGNTHQKILLSTEAMQQDLPGSKEHVEERDLILPAELFDPLHQFSRQVQSVRIGVVADLTSGEIHRQQQWSRGIGQAIQPIGLRLKKFAGRLLQPLLGGIGIKTRSRCPLESFTSLCLCVGHRKFSTDNSERPAIAGQVVRGEQQYMLTDRHDHQSRSQQRWMGQGERRQEMSALDFLKPQLLLGGG